MCGIAAIINKKSSGSSQEIHNQLIKMGQSIRHRGPDGEGYWVQQQAKIGLAHKRLSIIETSQLGHQPMHFANGRFTITYNGEIYNYIELREELSSFYSFLSHSDTEVILAAYMHWGKDCVLHLRGMFSFVIWDEKENKTFAARDRFGIKPFYYAETEHQILIASECKAILPHLPQKKIHIEGLKDYLAFQFPLAGKTLFQDVFELLPAHRMEIKQGKISIERYWEVHYVPDYYHTQDYFEEKLSSLIEDSIKFHLRADVPLGAYVSGGLDSSTVAALANGIAQKDFLGFTGKFSFSKDYDESNYARLLCERNHFPLYEIDITEHDFVNHIASVIYHLDYPVAGPGSFPQYMVSQLAAQHRKVVLGGQGGDEIFGGYTRYLIAYFEQCIKSAIDGDPRTGSKFVVTYESIIPNLVSLKNYKPMLKEFWRDGLFEDMDQRYFRLINRAPHLGDAIRWEALGDYSPFETFKEIFHGKNVGKQSYFDLMTHFDFKTLLPALLQVEDRMSMASGLESRVPLLDHPIVELTATIPSNIKFENGDMKHIFKKVINKYIPEEIINRKDKMGFPTPLVEWSKKGVVNEFIRDTFNSSKAKQRDYIDNAKVIDKIANESKFGRNLWGFLCLELWQQQFFD
ncbi:MAG TPA: asparagine synthase (glutamine-hydrolyzing) [Saprospiraceae bacterium]|nr:asparagine synthase (glutamine-hydrolyzing) [Saprospiraceae bacterium]